jgi:hypothetical protein
MSFLSASMELSTDVNLALRHPQPTIQTLCNRAGEVERIHPGFQSLRNQGQVTMNMEYNAVIAGYMSLYVLPFHSKEDCGEFLINCKSTDLEEYKLVFSSSSKIDGLVALHMNGLDKPAPIFHGWKTWLNNDGFLVRFGFPLYQITRLTVQLELVGSGKLPAFQAQDQLSDSDVERWKKHAQLEIAEYRSKLDTLTKKISNAVSSANMLGDENGLSDTDIDKLIQSLEKTRLDEFAKTYETLNKVQVYGVF